MIRISLYFLLWGLLMAVAIFAIQNLQLVSISYLAWRSISLPAGLILITCAGLGSLVVTILQILVSNPGSNPTSNKRSESVSSNKTKQPQPKTAKKSEPSNRSPFTTQPRDKSRDKPREQPISQTPYQPPKAQKSKPQPKDSQGDDWESRTNDWDNW
jgi:lipopolysaccharide assembly protein A